MKFQPLCLWTFLTYSRNKTYGQARIMGPLRETSALYCTELGEYTMGGAQAWAHGGAQACRFHGTK
jgi:hypothetical protein